MKRDAQFSYTDDFKSLALDQVSSPINRFQSNESSNYNEEYGGSIAGFKLQRLSKDTNEAMNMLENRSSIAPNFMEEEDPNRNNSTGMKSITENEHAPNDER